VAIQDMKTSVGCSVPCRSAQVSTRPGVDSVTFRLAIGAAAAERARIRLASKLLTLAETVTA
jgi:hypothetical protein